MGTTLSRSTITPLSNPSNNQPPSGKSAAPSSSSRAPTAPAVTTDPKAIRYLAFQGGGGKGNVYLGALKWLEQHGAPLPIAANAQYAIGNSIKGVSGSSAGAITALFVALGYDAQGASQMFMDVNNSIIDQAFQAGDVPSVPLSGVPAPKGASAITTAAQALDQHPALTITALAVALGPILTAFIASQYTAALSAAKTNKLLTFLVTNLAQSLACLLVDDGVLAGKALRAFLGNAISKSPLISQAGSPMGGSQIANPTTVTFSTLSQYTNVKLAVTGTNISTTTPVVFSVDTTPNFPVVDAVAISASFPFLFKPTYLGPSAFPNDSSLTGFYNDGGLINNLPMHVFDAPDGKIAQPTPPSAGTSATPAKPPSLNPNLLALRLTPHASTSSIPGPVATPKLSDFAMLIVKCLEYGANQVQFQGAAEQAQSIAIDTGDLGLTDFYPATATLNDALKNASDACQAFYPNAKLVTPS